MGVVKKTVKKVVKGVGKVVKGVAKGIKGLAKGVVKGIKKVAGGAMKLIGKLGPIGTIAMSFILPGIGAAFAGMWNGAAAGLVGNTLGGTLGSVVSAVGKGMQFLSKGVSFLKTGVGNVTDKIGGVFKQVGGSISDGASNLWNSAKEFVGISPSKVPADLGKAVGESALKMSPSSMPTSSIGDLATNVSGVSGPTSQATLGAGSDFVSGLTTNKFGQVVSTESSQVVNPDSIGSIFDKAAGVPQGDPTQMSALQTGGLQTTPLQDVVTSSHINSIGAAPTSTGGSDTMKKLAEAGSNLLSGMAEATPAVPFTSPGVDPLTGAQRFGVSGESSAGGSFLNQAQLAQQELLRKQLQQQA